MSSEEVSPLNPKENVPVDVKEFVKPEPSAYSTAWKIFESNMTIILAIIIIALILLLAYFFAPTTKSLSNLIIKSPIDNREYMYLTLDNGLKTLLVSDPTTQTAGVALEVGVGSYAEPSTIPGLAHFMEHMLFRGNQKYQNSSAFEDFLSMNGGSSNAFTEVESTNFYYQVSNDALQQSLDMFSHFFIDPTFPPSAIEVETIAVNSEFEKDLQLDEWRFFNMLTLISDPNSPFSEFTIGDTQTLQTNPSKEGIDMQQQLRQFFHQYYSSNIMSFSVIANYPLQTLKNWVQTNFGVIQNNDVTPPDLSQLPKPFSGSYTQQLVQYMPIEAFTKVSLVFQMTPEENFMLEKPLNYISNLINDQSAGGLYSVLRNAGYITALDTETVLDTSTFTIYSITATLTADGYNSLETVIDEIFGYIALLQKSGDQEYYYNQYAQISEINFNYSNPSNEIMDQASSYAANLQIYPVQYIISGSQVYYQYDSQLINSYLSQLNPSNVNLVVASSKFNISPNFETQNLISFKHNLNWNKDQREKLQDGSAPSFKGMIAKHLNTNERQLVQEVTETKTFLAPSNGVFAPKKSQLLFADKSPKIFSNQPDPKVHHKKLRPYDAMSKTTDIIFVTPDGLPMQSLNIYNNLYQVYYTSAYVPQPYVNELTSINADNYTLSLPPNNTYIPQNFSMINLCQNTTITGANGTTLNVSKQVITDYFAVQCPDNYTADYAFLPVSIIDNNNAEVYYKLDRSYNIPAYAADFELRSPLAYQNATMQAILNVYCAMLQDTLQSDSWQMQQAGYSIELTCDIQGFNFNFYGFSDKMTEVIDTIMKEFAAYQGDQESFNIFLNDTIQNIENNQVQALYSRAMQLQYDALVSVAYSDAELLAALDTLTYNSFSAAVTRMKNRLFMEGVIVGNIVGSDAEALVNQCVTELDYNPASPGSLLTEKVSDLTGEQLIYREWNAQNDSEDNCILSYYQDGPRNPRNATLINLLNLVLDNEVYQHFRGELALGYIATSIIDVTDDVIGINIIIEGSVENPSQMDYAIETFLKDYRTELASMSDDDFQGLVNSLNGTLSQKLPSLQDEAASYMNKINDGTLDFNSRQEMMVILDTLTLDDLVEYYTNLFSLDCKKLSIQIYSHGAAGSQALPTAKLTAKSLYCQNAITMVPSIYDLDTIIPRYGD
jgi:secreted Zn-dependent insulinase-like peptidase